MISPTSTPATPQKKLSRRERTEQFFLFAGKVCVWASLFCMLFVLLRVLFDTLRQKLQLTWFDGQGERIILGFFGVCLLGRYGRKKKRPVVVGVIFGFVLSFISFLLH